MFLSSLKDAFKSLINLRFVGAYIDSLSKNFVEKINIKYPNANIGYITIKPSIERKSKLSDIKKINEGVKLIASDFPNLVYIDVFNKLLDKGEVTSKFILQDGLHLNKEGYKVLTRAVKEKIKM